MSLVPNTQLCSARAKWKSEGVTVAGFNDGTVSTSLAGLFHPHDLLVDAVGNMHITDSLNNRILYWPKNSTEGWIVAGTDEFGSEANQLYSPTAFASNDQYCLSYKHA